MCLPGDIAGARPENGVEKDEGLLMNVLYQERQFGRGVGTVLIAIGLWFLWGGRASWLVYLVLVLGTSLLALSIVAPVLLRYPSRAWMGLAHKLSWVSTRVVLAVVFFGIVTPVGLIRRAFGRDPLRRRAGRQETYWHPYRGRQKDPKHFEKMY